MDLYIHRKVEVDGLASQVKFSALIRFAMAMLTADCKTQLCCVAMKLKSGSTIIQPLLCCRPLYEMERWQKAMELKWYVYDNLQMYMTLDALADGGVYAGVPKDKAINLVAHTMMVCKYTAK